MSMTTPVTEAVISKLDELLKDQAAVPYGLRKELLPFLQGTTVPSADQLFTIIEANVGGQSV